MITIHLRAPRLDRKCRYLHGQRFPPATPGKADVNDTDARWFAACTQCRAHCVCSGTHRDGSGWALYRSQQQCEHMCESYRRIPPEVRRSPTAIHSLDAWRCEKLRGDLDASSGSRRGELRSGRVPLGVLIRTAIATYLAPVLARVSSGESIWCMPERPRVGTTRVVVGLASRQACAAQRAIPGGENEAAIVTALPAERAHQRIDLPEPCNSELSAHLPWRSPCPHAREVDRRALLVKLVGLWRLGLAA